MDRRSFFAALVGAAASLKAATEIVPTTLLSRPNTETFWDRVLETVMRGGHFEPKPIYLALLDENKVEINPLSHSWYRRVRVSFNPAQGGCAEMAPVRYPEVRGENQGVNIGYAVLLFGDEPVFSSPVRLNAKYLSSGDTLQMNLTVSMG